MRAVRTAAAAVLLLAAPSPIPALAGDDVVCVVADPEVTESSGLLAVADGYRVVNDGGDAVQVMRLDGGCAVVATTTATVDPYDVEDLALGPGGELWVADIGDNNVARSSVAVIVLPDEPGEVAARIRRLQYPDRPHDAEALIADADGRAVVLTKTLSGLVGIYRSEPLDLSDGGSSAPQPLQKVGQLQLRQTGTPGGPVGPPLNNLMSTGAARCADLIAVRSYTDAYLWRGTDVASTIADAEPIVIPLPAQQQGEAIAFAPGCGELLVHSEGQAQPLVRVGFASSGPQAQDGSAAAAVSAASERSGTATGGGHTRMLVTIAAVALLAAGGFCLARTRRGR